MTYLSVGRSWYTWIAREIDLCLVKLGLVHCSMYVMTGSGLAYFFPVRQKHGNYPVSPDTAEILSGISALAERENFHENTQLVEIILNK